MSRLDLFSFFHLNLMFSSIEEEARPKVIRRCYWPLLKLAADNGVPLGIELSGFTLETIQKLDPAWVAELGRLIAADQVELIGSGFAQIIGPLVPSAVNDANQKIGMQVYNDLLSTQPTLALVNEQAWSAGLVEHYIAAGYRGIIMEWDNPAADHPEWPSELRYAPQRVAGADGQTIPVIWNQSIAFQRFQRYAHGELDLDEVVADLGQRVAAEGRSWAVYGNDAEIFDFRPGRFHTEEGIAGNEWDRITKLFQTLQTDARFRLIRPSSVLDRLEHGSFKEPLRLESATQPTPVKKQAKYNITRWALTGRDDLDINSRCHKLLASFDDTTPQESWKELCYLWSSDLRTHLTQSRWQRFQSRLSSVETTHKICGKSIAFPSYASIPLGTHSPFQIKQTTRLITVSTPFLQASFIPRRGLALESLSLTDEYQPLAGTLHHGFFDHIGYGNDYYTGHLVMEIPGQHKVTDLNAVTPEIGQDPEGWLCLVSDQSTPIGPIRKIWRMSSQAPELDLIYELAWPGGPKGALRLGHLTLHPDAFEQALLSYRTLNGGSVTEHFSLSTQSIDHLAPVSTLISASQGVGMTGGWLDIGDKDRRILVESDLTSACVMGHVQFSMVPPSYFCRLTFSLQEIDDTFRGGIDRHSLDHRSVRFRFRIIDQV
jgi:hypothetical protein